MTPLTPASPPPAELLLMRPEFAGDLHAAASAVHGRRVLLTGAAGSIGTPLSRALLEAGPERLVLLDHHEHSLFSLERGLGAAPTAGALGFELADVRDRPRLRRIFQQLRPNIVIHLAAAKHVPYGERFPEGAVATNVLATAALLDLADAAGTEVFVYPSSDKSVQPPSVYGASKRLAEALVQSRAQERRWSVVRYVNIIGTRGSVIETFTQQVFEERPFSLTDERMTRYWISMDEALWCALMAVRCASPAQIVMPSCGEPVPIVETARRLAGWYRPERVPYPSLHTGIRPGERLHEVLLSHNETFAAEDAAPGVRAVATRRDPARLSDVPQVLTEIGALVEAGERVGLARACLAAADALQ